MFTKSFPLLALLASTSAASISTVDKREDGAAFKINLTNDMRITKLKDPAEVNIVAPEQGVIRWTAEELKETGNDLGSDSGEFVEGTAWELVINRPGLDEPIWKLFCGAFVDQSFNGEATWTIYTKKQDGKYAVPAQGNPGTDLAWISCTYASCLLDKEDEKKCADVTEKVEFDWA